MKLDQQIEVPPQTTLADHQLITKAWARINILEGVAGMGLPRERIDEGNTYTVEDGELLLLYQQLRVDGDLILKGSLVIL